MVVMTAKLTITRALLKYHVGRASEMAPNTCRLNMWQQKVWPENNTTVTLSFQPLPTMHSFTYVVLAHS